MATAALRFPPFLSSRAAPTTAAATCARRTAPATLRVAALPESASAPASTSTSDEPPQFSPPAGFKTPVPRRFAVKDGQLASVAGAALALPFRLGTGLFVLGYSVSLVSADKIPSDQYSLEFLGLKVKETSKIDQCRRPEKPIEIYEFEGCPFCRKVREMVSVLDLDVLFYPCPQKGPTFRPKVLEMGGKTRFPYMTSMIPAESPLTNTPSVPNCKKEVLVFCCNLLGHSLVDPNTGVAMYESDEIIKYLADTYGDGTVPIMLSLGLLTTITAGLAMIWRVRKGSYYTVSKLPPQPIEIWAYEGSPFCKIAREALVELELPHLLHSCARGSPKRQEIFKKHGIFQAPYIEDPNTGVKMFESAEIVEYLRATYTLYPQYQNL